MLDVRTHIGTFGNMYPDISMPIAHFWPYVCFILDPLTMTAANYGIILSSRKMFFLMGLCPGWVFIATKKRRARQRPQCS